jgi:hypothetical protein
VDFHSIVTKALDELPLELPALVRHPKRHAKSKDSGWKHGFLPYKGEGDMVHCIFYKKAVHVGIKRFK